MINIYISTFNRLNLAIGAARSLRKNILDINYKIILICGLNDTNRFLNPLFDSIIESATLNPLSRRMGFIAAYKDSSENNSELSLCIDDDIRLISPIALKERYTCSKYIPDNTFCVQIWKNYKERYPKHLKVKRLSNINQFIGQDKVLGRLAVNNWSEQIDNVWLHIDKGSEKMIPNRQKLIDYIDHGDGLSSEEEHSVSS